MALRGFGSFGAGRGGGSLLVRCATMATSKSLMSSSRRLLIAAAHMPVTRSNTSPTSDAIW